jgi:hypothetical protein
MSHLAIITPLTDKLKATILWSPGFKKNKPGYYKGAACFVQDSIKALRKVAVADFEDAFA